MPRDRNSAPRPSGLYPEIVDYLKQRETEFGLIEDQRKRTLTALADFLESRIDAGEPARLVFICTHNSRRSHMAQLWTAASAHYYQVEGIESFSGGTEATSFEPRAVAAMKRAGLRIDVASPGTNPVYEVRFGPELKASQAFSKVFSDPPNPRSDYVAVMTCSQADATCPSAPGASLRLSIPYDDPKDSDGTVAETETYDTRSRQISREMHYMVSRLK